MLTITDLVHVYPGGARALDGVTLRVAAGVFGLLGPNGAGKSTLMRALATLQVPTSGAIRFGDVDALAEPQRLRRTLGYLPQEFGVYPGVSVRDMLLHMAVLKGVAGSGERREAVDRLLARVNLWAARDRALDALSGGMRRRFGVAQALLGDPALLVLDEPSAGLDPEERNRLLDVVAEAGERAVVILSTHLVDEAAEICARVAVLAGGRIRLDGAPDELVAALRGRVWRRVAGRAEPLRAEEAAAADLVAPGRRPQGAAPAFRCAAGAGLRTGRAGAGGRLQDGAGRRGGGARRRWLTRRRRRPRPGSPPRSPGSSCGCSCARPPSGSWWRSRC